MDGQYDDLGFSRSEVDGVREAIKHASTDFTVHTRKLEGMFPDRVKRLGKIGREGFAEARLALLVPPPSLEGLRPSLRSEPNRNRHESPL
jgi:hypothetical protein